MTTQATLLAPVYPSMHPEELGRLLREAGYDIEPAESKFRPTYRLLSEPWFMIRLLGALEQRPDQYHSISVWRFIPVSPAVLVEVIHRTKPEVMFALLLAHRSGQLLVTHDILIGGGVTAHHLKHQLQLWRSDLAHVLQVVGDSQRQAEGHRSH